VPPRIYVEDFSRGPGGWFADRRYALPVWEGVAYCHGPWFLDANHAPPGAGYLHMVMWLYTHRRWYEVPRPEPLPYTNNRFLEGGFTTDFTHARVTARLRGRVDLRGAQLLLLVHSEIKGIMVNHVLRRHPFHVREEWTEQTVTLEPDEAAWTCLGGRHDLPDRGCAPVADVLADVNVDIMFVLFPLDVVPLCRPLPDPHRLRAGADYAVDPEHLPKGLILFDRVKIEFANATRGRR
jgi:hypothetical protein